MFRGLFKNQNRQADRRSDDSSRRPIFSATVGECPAMRQAIAQHGCFVLRGLFDPGALARIREQADFLSRAWDYMLEHGYTKGTDDFHLTDAFKAGHLPGTHIDVTELWSDRAGGSLFDEIATAIFGDTTHEFALRRSILHGKQNPLVFHQDGFFMGAKPTYNFWTPLQDVGVDAPAVEVVVGSGAPIIKDVDASARIAAYVEKTYGRQSYWLPTLTAGDVLVFTSMMFHRTQSAAQMSKTRYSLELRGVIKDRTLSIAGTPNDWSEIKTLQDAPA